MSDTAPVSDPDFAAFQAWKAEQEAAQAHAEASPEELNTHDLVGDLLSSLSLARTEANHATVNDFLVAQGYVEAPGDPDSASDVEASAVASADGAPSEVVPPADTPPADTVVPVVDNPSIPVDPATGAPVTA